VSDARYDVAIVGGGIAGCAAAFFLARARLRVCLFEFGRVGAGASGVNFGGVRQQGRALVELPVAARARELWARLPELIGTTGEFTPSGHLKLARSDSDMAELEAYARQAHNYGLALELIGRGALRSRCPWLAADLAGGSLCVSDGHANPRLVAPAFADAARGHGAEIHENTRIVAVGHDGARFTIRAASGMEIAARHLVNTAGAWGVEIARQFGEDVPLQASAPNCLATEPLPFFMVHALGVCGGGVAIRQSARGNVIIGGGESHVDMKHGRARPLAAICRIVGERAVALVPRLKHVALLRAWAGVEGEMPDKIPVVGWSRTRPGLIHAFGFSQHGFQLGPAIGAIVADLVTTGATSTPIAPFAIDRFARAA
jgi:sarcosine oxidase, subunit beta